jgi:hypothetical protein
MQTFNTQVDIHCHSKRHRLADADGLSCKWALDEIVNQGILFDDTTAHVRKVSFSQEKIPTKEPESTIITIAPV